MRPIFRILILLLLVMGLFGCTEKNKSLGLEEYGTVSGEVLIKPKDNKISGAIVELKNIDNEEIETVKTDLDGKYTINLKEGKYKIVSCYYSSIYVGYMEMLKDENNEEIIVKKSTSYIKQINLYPASDYTDVKIKAFDKYYVAIPNVNINIERVEKDYENSTLTTNAEGIINTKMLYGEYYVTAEKAGYYKKQILRYNNGPYTYIENNGGSTISAKKGYSISLRKLEEGYNIMGQVMYHTKEGNRVIFENINTGLKIETKIEKDELYVASENYYKINLPVGKYYVYIENFHNIIEKYENFMNGYVEVTEGNMNQQVDIVLKDY